MLPGVRGGGMALRNYKEIRMIGKGSYGEVVLVKCRTSGKKVSDHFWRGNIVSPTFSLQIGPWPVVPGGQILPDRERVRPTKTRRRASPCWICFVSALDILTPLRCCQWVLKKLNIHGVSDAQREAALQEVSTRHLAPARTFYVHVCWIFPSVL